MTLARACVCAPARFPLWGAASDRVVSAAPFEFHGNFRTWRPHLDGVLTLDEAVGKVVQALAATTRRTAP